MVEVVRAIVVQLELVHSSIGRTKHVRPKVVGNADVWPRPPVAPDRVQVITSVTDQTWKRSRLPQLVVDLGEHALRRNAVNHSGPPGTAFELFVNVPR